MRAGHHEDRFLFFPAADNQRRTSDTINLRLDRPWCVERSDGRTDPRIGISFSANLGDIEAWHVRDGGSAENLLKIRRISKTGIDQFRQNTGETSECKTEEDSAQHDDRQYRPRGTSCDLGLGQQFR